MPLNRNTRPFIIANFAMTVDGKISTRAQTPSQFTSAHDKRRLLAIRAKGDAVMVGRKTLEADNMSLGLPSESLRKKRIDGGKPPFPARVIISPSGRLIPTSRVFSSSKSPLIIFSKINSPRWIHTYPQVNWQQIAPFDIATCLRILKKQFKINTLVCEGGATLFKALAELHAIDELYLTIAPAIFGGTHAPTLTGLPGSFLSKLVRFTLADFTINNNECYLHYIVYRKRLSPH